MIPVCYERLPGLILVLNPPLAGDLVSVLPGDGCACNLSSWLGRGVEDMSGFGDPGGVSELDRPTPPRTKG